MHQRNHWPQFSNRFAHAKRNQVLDVISQLHDPGKRLDALRSFVLAELASGHTLLGSKTTLTRCLTMAAEAAILLRDQLPTADASFLHRLSVDDLLRVLNTICVANFMGAQVNDVDGIWSTDVSQLPATDHDILSAYERFLFSMSQWMSAFYASKPLHRALITLSEAERDDYRAVCETIARLYRQAYGLGRKAPKRASAEQQMPMLLDRARELRSLALCGDSPQSTTRPRLVASQMATARLFCIELLSPHDQPLVGFCVLTSDCVVFLVSREWNQQIRPMLQIAALAAPALETWKAALGEFTSIVNYDVREAIGRLGPIHGVSNIHLTDLTSHKLPWNAVLDPDNAYCWAAVGNRSASLAQMSPRAIHHWGEMEYGSNYCLTVQDENREVSQDGRKLLQYPDMPTGPVRVKGSPVPLPFSCYERWFLHDLARAVDVDFVPYCHWALKTRHR
jgi:hypothetical protein